MNRLALWTLVTSLAVGCAEPGPIGPPPAHAGEPITETVVTLHADGTETVDTRRISAASSTIGDVGVAAGELVTRDSGCAGASLWLHDQTGNVGNRICFRSDTTAFPENTVNLSRYCHTSIPVCSSPGSCRALCLTSWDSQARSLWAGSLPGQVWRPASSAPFCRTTFLPYERVDALRCSEPPSQVVFTFAVVDAGSS